MRGCPGTGVASCLLWPEKGPACRTSLSWDRAGPGRNTATIVSQGTYLIGSFVEGPDGTGGQGPYF